MPFQHYRTYNLIPAIMMLPDFLFPMARGGTLIRRYFHAPQRKRLYAFPPTMLTLAYIIDTLLTPFHFIDYFAFRPFARRYDDVNHAPQASCQYARGSFTMPIKYIRLAEVYFAGLYAKCDAFHDSPENLGPCCCLSSCAFSAAFAVHCSPSIRFTYKGISFIMPHICN